MRNRNITILVSLVGMLIIILFISLTIIFGALEPGYNHMTMMLSILGGIGGIRGFAFNVGVGTTGGLIIIFAIGLNRVVTQNNAKFRRIFLFIQGGLGLIGIAIIHCRQNCEVVPNMNPITALHGIFAFIAVLSLTLAPLPFYYYFKQDHRWERVAVFTLAMVILSIIFNILFWIMFMTNIFPIILGLVQRLEFLFVLVWILVISIKLLTLRKSNKVSNEFFNKSE